MYEKSALLTNTTGDLSILAGATFGGGTTINWACCIPTPEHVRKEWADTQGVHRWAVGCSRVVSETVLYSIFLGHYVHNTPTFLSLHGAFNGMQMNLAMVTSSKQLHSHEKRWELQITNDCLCLPTWLCLPPPTRKFCIGFRCFPRRVKVQRNQRTLIARRPP